MAKNAQSPRNRNEDENEGKEGSNGKVSEGRMSRCSVQRSAELEAINRRAQTPRTNAARAPPFTASPICSRRVLLLLAAGQRCRVARRIPFNPFKKLVSLVSKILRTGLLAVCLLTGAAANAQILVGPVAGAAASTARLDFKEGAEPKKSMVFGPTAGWMIHIPFGKFAVQPALMYVRKGVELEYNQPSNDSTIGLKASISSQLGYITLPINFVFTSAGDHGIQVFAGGYAALGVGGKRKVTTKITEDGLSGDTTYSDDVYFSDRAHNPQDELANSEFVANGGFKEQTGYFQTVDYGFQGGLGYLMTNGLQVQAAASMGTRNIFTKSLEEVKPKNSAKNMSFSLTVAYLFGGK